MILGKKHNCPAKILTCNNVLMLPMLRQVFIGETQVELTRLDYDLLHFFINNQDCALSYEQVYRQVWCSEYDESANLVIKNAVTRLRKKIGDDKDIGLIDNVRGYGYICQDHVD